MYRIKVFGVVLMAGAMLGACGSSSPGDTVAGVGSGGGGSGGPGAPEATVATTAPHKLFDSDFTGVCQGATQSKAKPYDKAAPGHKVLYFETYKKGLVQTNPSGFPSDWQVLFDANSDAFAAVDLVACTTRTSDAFVKDCDGYEDSDKKPTQNIAKLHTATYTLSVHEATSGKELGSTQLKADDNDCPMFVSFDSGSDTTDYYAAPSSDEIVAFIRPFAQP
jgi:hypothetical protein